MSKYMKRWISMVLAACVLFALSPAALMEAEAPEGAVVVEEAFDEPAAPDSAGSDDNGDTPATDEAPATDETPATDEAPAAEEAEDAEIALTPVDDVVSEMAGDMELTLGDEPEAPAYEAEAALDGLEAEDAAPTDAPCAYALVQNPGTRVCRDEALDDEVYNLSDNEVVLVVARAGDAVRALIDTQTGLLDGYIAASDIRALTPAEAEAAASNLAALSGLTLYEDDPDWPIPPEVYRSPLFAADFTRYSNDTPFVIQGKTITAHMVGNHSDCWSWARALYKMIWGVKFDNNFVGEPSTGHNLIRNLKDSERQLTGDNLKKFMKQSVPGCTLRICSCPRNCKNIDNDGCPSHEKHSLIVVEIREDGIVVMDNVTGNGTDRYDTRFYTYDNFAKHWARYKMVKYIKWPNAPEYDKVKAMAEAGVKPESITLAESSVIIRAGESQAVSVTVLPENAEDRSVTWTSSDPFVAYVDKNGALVSVNKGTATLTASTSNGITAKMDVNVVARNLKAKKVRLDQTGTVCLKVGETLQLNAALTPAYANPALAWKSTKKKVASVSSTGLVKALKRGTTTIVVKTASKKKAKVKIKVVGSNEVGKVTLDQKGTVKLSLGETLKLNATVSPANTNAKLKWKSSKKKVATVSDDGTVTPLKKGTTVIAVKAANKKIAKVKVKVVG